MVDEQRSCRLCELSCFRVASVLSKPNQGPDADQFKPERHLDANGQLATAPPDTKDGEYYYTHYYSQMSNADCLQRATLDMGSAVGFASVAMSQTTRCTSTLPLCCGVQPSLPSTMLKESPSCLTLKDSSTMVSFCKSIIATALHVLDILTKSYLKASYSLRMLYHSSFCGG